MQQHTGAAPSDMESAALFTFNPCQPRQDNTINTQPARCKSCWHTPLFDVLPHTVFAVMYKNIIFAAVTYHSALLNVRLRPQHGVVTT